MEMSRIIVVFSDFLKPNTISDSRRRCFVCDFLHKEIEISSLVPDWKQAENRQLRPKFMCSS